MPVAAASAGGASAASAGAGWLGLELLHAATPARTGTLRAARPRKSRRDIPFDSTLISVLARRGLAAVVGLWTLTNAPWVARSSTSPLGNTAALGTEPFAGGSKL